MPTARAAVLGSRAAVVAVTGHQARNRSVVTRRGDTTMRMSDDPAPGDYDDYYIASILRSESTTSSRKRFRGRAKSIIGWPLISTEQSYLTRAMPCSTPLAWSLNVAPTT